MKIYALVIVCSLTSAVDILALDSLQTQEVVSAILRHSARYGLPACLRVDNGSNLVSLQGIKFQIKDVNSALHKSAGPSIEVTTAKAHESNGRVERKIRDIRRLLESSLMTNCRPLTPIQWQSTFAMVTAELNNVPLAAGDVSTPDHPFNVLTPNRLLTGRNHQRFTHFETTVHPTIPSQSLARVEDIMSQFVDQLASSIIRINSKPRKWSKSSSPLPDVGDIVYTIRDSNNAATTWTLAKILKIKNDGRKFELLVPRPGGTGKPSMLIRSPRDCVLITKSGSVPTNSDAFMQLYHS